MMELMHRGRRDGRYHHERSSSVPVASVSQQKQNNPIASTGRRRSNSLETTTYLEEQQRKEIMTLKTQYSKWSVDIAGPALHHNRINDNRIIHDFIDTVRDYDQELLHLEYHLEGPTKIHYVEEEVRAKVIPSMCRARDILTSVGWCVRHLEDLWTASNEAAETGNAEVELRCHEFWEKMAPRVEIQVDRLKPEIPLMKSVIHHFKHYEEITLMGQLQQNVARSKKWKLTSSLRTGDIDDLFEMSGALRADNAPKTATNTNQKVEGKRTKINPASDTRPSYKDRLRYRYIKTREKTWFVGDPNKALAAWTAFLDDLEKRPGIPNTGTILLKRKVETKKIIWQLRLEMQQQQQEENMSQDEDGSHDDYQNEDQEKDEEKTQEDGEEKYDEEYKEKEAEK
ncbi:hypothetical protein GGR54DRAFT_303834 [Hypoxylon sp. NC1633]|nr:hypothetical protein GGR54DRAFT_303834 [Hypoxylon sp. NC1633]